jgi:hypothetical protein
MPGKRTVTLVSAGDLEYLYDAPAITVKKWRKPQRSAADGDAPRHRRGEALGPRPPYDPEAAADSILGKRYAHISGRDVYDLDVVIERIEQRTRTNRRPDESRVAEVRERATVPADAVVAGYAEIAELLGLDQRRVRTMDERDGQLPPPIALVGPEGRKSRVQVYAASQFARDPRYSEQHAQELARRHVEGP